MAAQWAALGALVQGGMPGVDQQPTTEPAITPGAGGMFAKPLYQQGAGYPTLAGQTGGTGGQQVGGRRSAGAQPQQVGGVNPFAPTGPTPEQVSLLVNELNQQIKPLQSKLSQGLFPGLNPGSAFEAMERGGGEYAWKPPPDWQRTMAMSTPIQGFLPRRSQQTLSAMQREVEDPFGDRRREIERYMRARDRG